MPEKTIPTLEAVIALINETSVRNAGLVKEAFDAHEAVTSERDKYQRLQMNVMNGKMDEFIHEQACKYDEQTAALADAVAERRHDFAA